MLIGGAVEPRKTRKCSDNQSLDNQAHDNLKVTLKKPSGFERKRPKHPKWRQKAVMFVQRSREQVLRESPLNMEFSKRKNRAKAV